MTQPPGQQPDQPPDQNRARRGARRRQRVRAEIERNRRGEHAIPTWVFAVVTGLILLSFLLVAFTQ
jgi:hypothetical protein